MLKLFLFEPALPGLLGWPEVGVDIIACLGRFSILNDRLLALIKPPLLPLDVGGLVPYAGGLDCVGNRSEVALTKLEANEEAVPVFGAVDEPPP